MATDKANAPPPESDEDLANAFRYRQRAEEVRVIAQTTKDASMRRILAGVADDYERMAGTLENIARTGRTRDLL
jgi:hypothetical protein